MHVVASLVSIGESVPQMKDAMAHGSDPEILVDCFGTHRRSPTVEMGGCTTRLCVDFYATLYQYQSFFISLP